jgi:hypothetical protein
MRSNCLVCGNKDYFIFKPPVAAIFSDYPLDGKINFNLCPSCHFGWNTSAALAEDYNQYYKYFNKHHIREGTLREIDSKYFTSIFKKIINYIDLRGKNILDYGSGDKSFSVVAKHYGAENTNGYDIGGVTPISSHYDLIVCLHAMEHFFDFNINMVEFKRILKKKGMIYIAVPDMEGYLENYYGAFNAIDFEHINHFSVDSLGEMVLRHNFEVLEIGRSVRQVSENVSYPEVWVIAQSNENRKEKRKSPHSKVINTLTQYLSLSIDEFNDVINWYREVKKAALILGKKKIILIGLGTPALRLIEACKNDLPDVICDNDERLSGRTIYSKNVVDFKQAIKISPIIESYFIILAVNNVRIQDFLLSQGVNRSDISMYEWIND